jgi:RimJ/RimL family protein N-acetyltransferase
MAKRIHAELDWHGGKLVLRDLAEADLPALADYWTNATPADFERLGVDASRLGDHDWMVDRFRGTIPGGDPDQPRQAFAMEMDGRLIGYTNLNCYAPERNFSHWHLIDPTARAGGVSSALYPWRLRTYFACTRMEVLTHQTRPGNEGVNRLLDRFVPVAETRFVAEPDGLSRPGIFNLRYVSRADAARIFEEHALR